MYYYNINTLYKNVDYTLCQVQLFIVLNVKLVNMNGLLVVEQVHLTIAQHAEALKFRHHRLVNLYGYTHVFMEKYKNNNSPKIVNGENNTEKALGVAEVIGNNCF